MRLRTQVWRSNDILDLIHIKVELHKFSHKSHIHTNQSKMHVHN